jgi:hypothetical protein
MFKETPKSELITYISQMKESEQKDLLSLLKTGKKVVKKSTSKKATESKSTAGISPRTMAWYKSLPKFNLTENRRELIYEAIEEKRTARR